ncbi:MAG: SHOCT domain-containing protein [Aquabacterium sp.]|uniref:SHOCT domain-containing protein n=1 Tax=Aquabacterium sp. TaxID=1872578 RepID=UPI0025C118C4|nr:SHOCT domain-containing protein [Aquabacterium sp.]MBI5925880.1 SHOCT domain-containing protein [Aquabacterium sp.]
MRFEISERVTTSRSDKELLAALQAQFQKVAHRVDTDGQRFKASALDASFGSINRKDEALVYVKPIEGGQLLVADVLYRPSMAFWIILLITAFSAIGWLIPIFFYITQKKTVEQAVRTCFERVKNEFTQAGLARSPVPSTSFEDALEQLGRLKDKGLLNDEEFAARKQTLLDAHAQGAQARSPAVIAQHGYVGSEPQSIHGGPHAIDLDLPPGIKGWSWGAFFLNFFWAIPNRTWIGLLTAIPIIGFPMPFVLGFKGREWAWRNRQWDSVEHFNRVQRQWTVAGAVFYVVAISIVIVGKAYPVLESKFNQADEAEHSALKELGGTQPASHIQQEVVASSGTSLESSPMAQTPANNVTGNLDLQTVNMAFAADTVAGKISMGLDMQQQAHILLNGAPIFKRDPAIRRTPVKLFDLSGHRQALLVASVGGRGKCDTLYFFVILSKTQGASWTPEFGSCSGGGQYIQTGDRIDLSIPDNGLILHVRFENDQVTENGHVIAFHPDSDDITPIQ